MRLQPDAAERYTQALFDRACLLDVLPLVSLLLVTPAITVAMLLTV